MEDKLGVAYEPYIFAALNSAKVMVVLGTRPEHFNAVWVKNEWSRYLALIKNGAKKTLIPAYRDMDPYDLPEEFSHLQAQDMSKLGFMQDLTRGIKKIIDTDDKPIVKETTVQANSTINIAPLLKRAFMFLEDGDFERADDFCEQVLNQDPENAEAYLGKLMAELHVKRQEELADCAEPFDDYKNYQKAVRFGDVSFSAIMKGYNSSIKERNARKAEEARKESLYLKAIDDYNSADVARIQDAINIFASLAGYKDSDEYIRLCQVKIEKIRLHEEKYRQEQERLAEEKRIAEEQTRLERQRQAEIDHVKAEKRAKRNKKIAIIVSPIIAVVIAFIIILNSVIIPNNKYNNAVALYNKQNYLEAAEIFYDVWEYKDSNEYYKKCYQKYYKNDSLIVSNSKEMPYLIVNNGYVRRKENATIPSKIIIPDLFDGVYICKIETEAFEDCGSIEYVQISSNIEIIGERAFSWCSNLKDIKLSEGLTQIGADAFSFTAIDSIYIPQSVNSIGSGILHGTEMNSIEVDQKNINYRSSGNCLIDIINKEIIAGCKNSIIPSDGSVNIISYDAFGFCDGLTKIIISNGINTLDRFCFSGSHDLVEITLPTTIQKIGHASFYLCDQLTTINFVGTKSQWYEIEKDDDWDLLRSDSETGTRSKGKYLIHCTDGTISN